MVAPMSEFTCAVWYRIVKPYQRQILKNSMSKYNGLKNMSNVDQIPSTDLRDHFDDRELPNVDVTVDSEALSQP